MASEETLGYRLKWRLHVILLSMYGPADGTEETDPIARLKRERALRHNSVRTPAAGHSAGLVPVTVPALLRKQA